MEKNNTLDKQEHNSRTIRLQVCQGKLVGFLAQDETAYIQAIRSDTRAMLCPGVLLLDNNILVPVILIKLGNNTIYMAYFNYYELSQRACFESLIKQQELYLIFYNESRRKFRRIAVANALVDFLLKSREFIEKFPAWSSLSFDKVQEKLHCCRARDLWKQFSQTT